MNLKTVIDPTPKPGALEPTTATRKFECGFSTLKAFQIKLANFIEYSFQSSFMINDVYDLPILNQKNSFADLSSKLP